LGKLYKLAGRTSGPIPQIKNEFSYNFDVDTCS